MKTIYLDYNATTPIDPRVGEAMLPFIRKQFGNPSSSHRYGVEAKKAVELARRQVAGLLGCGVDEVIFTSGGSESNNYAIIGAARARREYGNHIITSAIEHPAVLEVCRYLETSGYNITYLEVDAEGLVDPADVEKAITPQSILVTIMHANNEVGSVQDIARISGMAHRKGVLMHSDCAQSIGKIPVRVNDLGVDLLSVAGHKLYAPKGIGALYIRSGVKLEKMIYGANHEMNLRAGTENVIGIVGLGKACELIMTGSEQGAQHLKNMRDRVEQGLLQALPEAKVNGPSEKRLPNTCSISFRGLEANTILSELSTVAASAGAACHAESVEVSHVLEAMKVPVEYAMGTVRLSVGRFTTPEEIDQAVSDISEVVRKLQPKDTIMPLVTGMEDIHLTRYTHGLGCACKLRPQVLEAVLQKLPPVTDPAVLVGAETSDDAAVYRINDTTAIVQTVDFFTPIVDDPFQFGVIAAVNSLSDIYAMGGKPLFALNVVGFPSNRLPVHVLEEILKGAQSVAEQAGISIIGGHTVDDTEPKFGLAVTGIIAPEKVVSNRGAKSGDRLVLTKPIGTGILSTALKQGLLESQQTDQLIRTMATLNEAAAEAMQNTGVNACTDITGFGLLGHLMEMMNGSGTSCRIRFSSIPFLNGVFELAASGVIPGGTRDNFSFTESHVRYDPGLSEIKRLLLNDAQTSGGLLIAVPEERLDTLLSALKERAVDVMAVIGEVGEARDARIYIDA